MDDFEQRRQLSKLSIAIEILIRLICGRNLKEVYTLPLKYHKATYASAIPLLDTYPKELETSS
jgi:hypothetical protein